MGAVLYHLVVGRPPFLGTSIAETISAVMEQDPIPPRKFVKGLPRDIETICLKCLEKDPAKRYPNARALAMDLERFLKGDEIHAKPISAWRKGVKWFSRNRAFAASVLISFTAIFIFTYLFFFAPGTVTIVTQARIRGKMKRSPPNLK